MVDELIRDYQKSKEYEYRNFSDFDEEEEEEDLHEGEGYQSERGESVVDEARYDEEDEEDDEEGGERIPSLGGVG